VYADDIGQSFTPKVTLSYMERHAIFRGRSRCRLLQGSRSLTLKVTQFTPDVTDFFTPEVTVHRSTVNTRIPSQNTRFARINAGFLRRRSLRALDPFTSALCLELLARIAEVPPAEWRKTRLKFRPGTAVERSFQPLRRVPRLAKPR
jgi:hypothetical protein